MGADEIINEQEIKHQSVGIEAYFTVNRAQIFNHS